MVILRKISRSTLLWWYILFAERYIYIHMFLFTCAVSHYVEGYFTSSGQREVPYLVIRFYSLVKSYNIQKYIHSLQYSMEDVLLKTSKSWWKSMERFMFSTNLLQHLNFSIYLSLITCTTFSWNLLQRVQRKLSAFCARHRRHFCSSRYIGKG